MVAVAFERAGSIIQFLASASHASIVKLLDMNPNTTLVSVFDHRANWYLTSKTLGVAHERWERLLADPMQSLINLNRATQTCALPRRILLVRSLVLC